MLSPCIDIDVGSFVDFYVATLVVKVTSKFYEDITVTIKTIVLNQGLILTLVDIIISVSGL